MAGRRRDEKNLSLRRSEQKLKRQGSRDDENRILGILIGQLYQLFPAGRPPVWSKYWSEASISSIENLIALITVPVPHRRPG
jgi:hypothetical protein